MQEAGEAAVGAAVGRIEADCLLAVAERVGEAAEAGERGGAVPAARGALGAEGHGAVVVPQRLGVLALLVPLVAQAGHILEAPAARRRRRREGRRRSRSVSKKRRGVNAAPRGGHAAAAAHDAPVAVVAGAGSEHVRAGARRGRRGRRDGDAPGRADVTCGERISHRRARRAPAVPAAAAAPAAAPTGEYQRARSAPPVPGQPRGRALRRQLAGVAPPARQRQRPGIRRRR
ncbi:Os01g0616366, partial [Oryza sativa Japonica Group]